MSISISLPLQGDASKELSVWWKTDQLDIYYIEYIQNIEYSLYIIMYVYNYIIYKLDIAYMAKVAVF